MPSKFQKILVATDFSPSAERALEVGMEWALGLGARLHLVHAFDLSIPAAHPYALKAPDPFIRECWLQAPGRLEEAIQRGKGRGLDVDSLLCEVPAAQAIAAEAEQAGCDLIVIGTRGNRGLKHILLGSVAEHTLRIAPCPVLVVQAVDD